MKFISFWCGKTNYDQDSEKNLLSQMERNTNLFSKEKYNQYGLIKHCCLLSTHAYSIYRNSFFFGLSVQGSVTIFNPSFPHR